MSEYKTELGSLKEFKKGGVDVIEDNPKNYVFSNVFEVAERCAPYERVAVGINLEYTIEATRAEGDSPWFAADHDEFALCMDGEVEVHLVKLNDPRAVVAEGANGAHLVGDTPDGRKMGRIILKRGHQALLPKGAAYRFSAAAPAVVLLQTMKGPVTVEKWAEICQTDDRP
ncbi:hydroxyquinol 1,2-dioxygenase [Marinibaculum pumilum]|uniref:Hydroxyquinol 1,2-dioxygenase n=1 Tax=Marinibaculum pumilum TaxID=1766165 RepID=A0ABV7KXH0_9PROT